MRNRFDSLSSPITPHSFYILSTLITIYSNILFMSYLVFFALLMIMIHSRKSKTQKTSILKYLLTNHPHYLLATLHTDLRSSAVHLPCLHICRLLVCRWWNRTSTTYKVSPKFLLTSSTAKGRCHGFVSPFCCASSVLSISSLRLIDRSFQTTAEPKVCPWK